VAFLSLTDDELSLLRFTCDLFFVEESPLHVVDAEQREPDNYEDAYQSLVNKGIVDPHGFRITDDALNRIAPVTECDGRVVHLVQARDGTIAQTDWYLLDEIAVQYFSREGVHALGPDLDPDELREHLARRLVPRKSTGDHIDLLLRPVELLALSQLARGAGDEPLPEDRARMLLGNPPSLASSASAPQLVARMPVRASEPRRRRAPGTADGVTGDETWDVAIVGLLESGALGRTDAGLTVRPAVRELASSLAEADRHTFVRYDFGDDDWVMRETTFVPADGSLYFLGAEGDRLRLRELDGESLRDGLRAAVGSLPRDPAAPPPRRLRDLLVGDPAVGGSAA
jgi:hypothetical protein